ncbi:MAG: Flp family type IVb pilin [Hyphomicrobiales bacterium]|nr:Flp family type IVb pilin [Hyphomicrobiales bacterium]
MNRTPIIRLFRRLVRDAKAATSIEYAIIAAGIAAVAAVLVGIIATLGVNVTTMWTAVKTALH